LARTGFELLNGGYDGTMKASCKGAKDAGGHTIGVTCPNYIRDARGELAPNGYLDEILVAPDLLARIRTMIRLSGGFIVLDGGTGTLSELGITWEFVSKGTITPRPIIIAGHAWDTLFEEMHAHRATSTRDVHQCDEPDEIVRILEKHAVPGTRRRDEGIPSKTIADDTATVESLKKIMYRFIEEREWQPFHDPKNLSASIAIEAAELMEHFQWLRSDQLDTIVDDESRMARIREEIADVLAYVLSFAQTMKIDLAAALADKMKKNAVKYPTEHFRGRFE
jgi:uncharacterized protein (TIGR00725 family)